MKIAIVNDVYMAVNILDKLISEKTNHEVIWKAYDGKEAFEKCQVETPDIILMDLIMPVMDGVESTKQIMKSCPCAILIVTSSVQKNIEQVFEAMGHGALDVVKTPSLGLDNQEDTTQELIEKIQTISRLIGLSDKSEMDHHTLNEAVGVSRYLVDQKLPPIVAIGASTGGPKAVATILSRIPSNVPFATVVIQHIDQEFSQSFARWLSEQTPLPVNVAYSGQIIRAGNVYLAGSNEHLVIDGEGRLSYSKIPRQLPYKPSIDIFFNCLRPLSSSKFVAILLTGMGSDGAYGLKLLRQEGWHTIAQESKSCVVFGMPKVAIETDAATDVLSLEEIPEKIIEKSKLYKNGLKIGADLDE